MTARLPDAARGLGVLRAAIHPSLPCVPANLLRWHVAFDRPVAVDDWARGVRLLDADGAPVAHALLDLPAGLWDRDGRVLTLLLHPGRIKQGLGGARAAGPALIRERRYRLEIDLGAFALEPRHAPPAVLEHRFVVAAPLLGPIDLAEWGILAPRAGTRAPCEIVFDRPLDRNALLSALWFEDVPGERTDVRLDLASDGCSVRAVPVRPWRTRPAVRVGGGLEDIAGNRVESAFEQKADGNAVTMPRLPGSRT